MTQQDIYKYLKKRKTWATCKQVARAIGTNTSTASIGLKKLSARSEIRKRTMEGWKREYVNKI